MHRYEKEIKEATFRDIEKALLTATTFNYNPEKTHFYSVVDNELSSPTRAEEFDK